MLAYSVTQIHTEGRVPHKWLRGVADGKMDLTLL